MSVAGIQNKLQTIKHTHKIYLVGGIVRDILLRRDTKDIDLACKDARGLAKKFAKATKGSYFSLDEENKIYRVVLKLRTTNDQPPMIFNYDFAELRGGSIEADLSLRDFTIDAMAMGLVDSSLLIVDRKNLIDPFGGQKDLKNKTIRMVGKDIYKDDPLRMLRAFRLAAVLGFKMEAKSLSLISRQNRLIKKVSMERVREELLKILSCPASVTFIKAMDKQGLLEVLLPEINKLKAAARNFYGPAGVWSHTLSGLSHLENIILKTNKYLPGYGPRITRHLQTTVITGVPRWVTLKIAYLLHDFGKPDTETKEGRRSRFFGHELAGAQYADKILARLHFSNKETNTIKNIIMNHMRPGNLSALDQISDKAVYRYFRDLKEEGLDTLVLSIADAYTTEETVITRKKQDIYPVNAAQHLRVVRAIIKRYYTEHKQIVPRNLLNGHEIMARFKLSEGPLIGQMINNLKEAQAQKLVTTKTQAYEYCKKMLTSAAK
ncbi:MAG: HD domain-containing protein [bacterium]|nr:HD domain-containing protein [bacterium]